MQADIKAAYVISVSDNAVTAMISLTQVSEECRWAITELFGQKGTTRAVPPPCSYTVLKRGNLDLLGHLPLGNVVECCNSTGAQKGPTDYSINHKIAFVNIFTFFFCFKKKQVSCSYGCKVVHMT